jgi:hypothetical protein
MIIKRPFRPAPLATCRRQRLLARGDGSVFSALSVTRSSGVQQGVAWLCSSLALRLRARRCGSGVSRCEGLGTTSWGKPGGDDCTRDVKVHRGAIPRRGAHGADEPTCDAVGLGHPVERCLVTTGRRDGRWVCSKFQMSEDLADHLALCDDGNDPEGAATAQRTGGHLQTKDAAQQPGPRPVRGARLRLPVHALLAWRREDAPAQVAVRRQTAAIAHQVAVR